MFRIMLTLFVVVIMVLCVSGVLFAAPAYGTHMPKKNKWVLGAEGNFILDRDIDHNKGWVSGNRYFLTSSYGLLSWFSLDGKIGLGNLYWDRTRGEQDLKYGTNFAGAYGFRIRGYENKELGIKSVVGFQHVSAHPNAKFIGKNKYEVIQEEWQIDAIVSKDIGNFIPYIGGRFGSLNMIQWVNDHDRKFEKTDRNYGVILGLDYWINQRMKVNLEGIFVDGNEVTMGISYDF